MTAKAGNSCLYEERTDDVSERQDCTVYRIGNETGAAVMTSYPVFPGIDLIYNDVHMQGRVITNARTDTVFEINHCSEGRVEYGLAGGFFYLAPGDLSVSVGADMGDSVYYPTGHYHGITVLVDTKKAPKCLSCFLDDVKVSPESLMERFTTDGKGFISRSDTGIEHVFSELYSVPEGTKVIGKRAFERCSMDAVELPASVEELGYDTFEFCEAEIRVSPENPIFAVEDGALLDWSQKLLVHYDFSGLFWEDEALMSMGMEDGAKPELEEKTCRVPDGIEVIGIFDEYV